MNQGIPFSAAIFDLDGTVLESMGVWRDVDRRFFAERGIDMPEDYSRAIQGKSFLQCAEYTAARFRLRETIPEMMEVWARMAEDEYAHRVALKPHARAYLRMLRRAGVRLAVATANQRRLFEPCLRRKGILELFDVILTTADVGDRGKEDGALFALAAERLGVPADKCAVFEDTLEGVEGAKRAGMRAYAIREIGSAHNAACIERAADALVDDFDELRRFHPFPDNSRRCAIFTARCEGDPAKAWGRGADDFILCADAGWRVARAAGATPDAVLGDFDTAEAPAGGNVLRFPREKDDTDTMLCLRHGLALGFEDFRVVGGFGGRVDHTLANFQTLAFAASRFARAEMDDGRRWATVVRDGAIRVARRPGKLSVFAMNERCEGVTIRGAKYSVEDAELTCDFPLGVSNEFAEDFAEIAVRRGTLLITVCPDE